MEGLSREELALAESALTAKARYWSDEYGKSGGDPMAYQAHQKYADVLVKFRDAYDRACREEEPDGNG